VAIESAARPSRFTDDGVALGARIRETRQRRELSLSELADLAGVSKSLISQIERGVAAPSIDTVRKIAYALEVPVFALFLEDADSQMVVRRDQRRVVHLPDSNATREILSPGLSGRMILLWVTFPPGEHRSGPPSHHVGEECVVVIRGALEIEIGEQRTLLEAGDSMTFDSALPHRFRNPTEADTIVIAAISPPSL
jgi:transcriptional regulator with XRE-family HTH domain